MKRATPKILLASLTAFVVLLGFQNCSEVSVEPADFSSFATSKTGVDLCTAKSEVIKSNLKFIFIVDRSGSNQQRFKTDPVTGQAILDPGGLPIPLPGTDPTGVRRFDPLKDFVSKFSSDPNMFWSLINFETYADLKSGFTNNTPQFLSLLNQQQADTGAIDNGFTSYLDALYMANDMINKDVQAARNVTPIVSSTYVVFFISDGAPIVGANLQSSDAIRGNVQTMINIKTANPGLVDAIQFSTALYYSDATPDATAKSLLQAMAQIGLGSYLEFGAGATIDFSKFAIPTRKQSFELKEFFLVNMNAVWWEGDYVADGDTDGLPDHLEPGLGSDPNKLDTDTNGVSDFIEWRVTGQPCRDAACSAAVADPFVQCSTLPAESPTVRFMDRDNDGLNDCEELLLEGDMLAFDSNNDYIPDGLAARLMIPIKKGSTNDMYQDYDLDGISNYNEIKRNTPLRTANNYIVNLKEASYKVAKVLDDSTQTCYRYDVQDLAMVRSDDLIRVYAIENTSVINEKRRLRVAEKPASRGVVRFSDGDFY